MNLADKSYLLTGGAGFIGSALGNRLVEMGATVYGLDSFFHASKAPRKFYTETGDVRFPELLAMRAKNADTIIHLAAAINVDFSHVMPDAAFDINLGGTLNVLEVARKMDKHVVYASSSEVYGTCQTKKHWGGPWHTRASALWEETKREMDACPSCQDGSGMMKETHPLDGQSPYAASKIAGDRACKAWSDTYGLRVNVLRCFNVYGPFQADDGYGGVIARFTRCALDARPMPIFGDGSQRRDYTWIDDAVEAYLLALTIKFDGPVNVGSGTTVSISEVAQEIHSIVGGNHKSVWEYVAPRAGEVNCLRADASKARALGWNPKVTFADGLRKYVDWAKS